MKAKKYLYIFVLCTLSLCTLVGCKNDSEKEPETFFSDIARPTWTAPDDYDYTSSLTAVVKVDLTVAYPTLAASWQLDDNDLLAAFSGETCLGTVSPKNSLFYLYIASPLTGNPSSVTLKYYSAYYKNLFEAKDAIQYKNHGTIGTYSEPLTPTFLVGK